GRGIRGRDTGGGPGWLVPALRALRDRGDRGGRAGSCGGFRCRGAAGGLSGGRGGRACGRSQLFRQCRAALGKLDALRGASGPGNAEQRRGGLAAPISEGLTWGSWICSGGASRKLLLTKPDPRAPATRR